jgi:catecholate siderophore receptor
MFVTGASGFLLCRADSPLQSDASYRPLIAHAIRLALTSSVAAGPAFGQSAAPVQELGRISVQAGEEAPAVKPEAAASPKYTEPLRDTPQTITVVPATVIKEQGLLTLRDVLSTIPGITFGAGEGGGGYGDSINLRGFTGSSDIAVDGVRDSAQYTRSDPFNLEQVELVNGASSVYSGAGSVGGTINLVSKQPHLQDERLVTAALGTDRYRRLTTDINQQLTPGAALRFNAMAHRNDAPGRDFENFDRWALAPAIGWGLDGATQWGLSLYHQQDDNVPQYGVPYFNGGPLPGVSPHSYFGYHNLDRQQIQASTATLTTTHVFDGGSSLRNLARYGKTRQLTTADAPQGVWCLDSGLNTSGTACTPAGTFQPYTIGTGATAGVLATGPRGTTRDTVNDVVYDQLDLTWHFKTGVVEHALVTGAAVMHESYAISSSSPFRSADGVAFTAADLATARSYFPLMNLHAPDSVYRGPLNWTLTAQSAGKLDNQALYAFDTLKFGSHWQVSTGLRYEHNSGYSQAAIVSTTAGTAGQITGLAAPAENTDDILSYRAALIYKPVEAGTIYVAYGNSKTPSRASVNGACTATTTVTAGVVQGTANCNLDPETAVNYELGTKWDLLTKRLALTASLFRNDRQNYRVSDPGNPDNPSGEQQLDGHARTEGVTLGVAGNLTHRWAVYANATLMRSKVLQGASDFVSTLGQDYTRGDPLTQAPERAASLWSTWQLPQRWVVGYGLTYQGETTLTQHSATYVAGPLVHSAAYSVHRAMVSWQPMRPLMLQLNVNNLFDQEYYTRIRNNGWATPGDTRNVVLSASYEF